VLFDYDIPSDSFPRNIINPEQTKSLISDLQGYSSTSLFIAVDVEGGKVNRLKEDYGFSAFLSPEELGNIGDYNFTEREALRISQELRDLGFNMNFAPVIDVNVNPDNPVIGRLGRSFSSDYQEVALHSKFFIRAHRQNNIISVVKHFPGHGSSLNDSHLGLVDVTETYKEKELFPYEFLQEESLLDAVMTAHVFNKEVDEEYPATLSPNFLEDILRERIGFKGVIISDDMQMGAIADHYGKEDSIIRAINSGCDILLFSNNGQEDYNENLPYEVQNIIYQAVIDGKISKERINDSYNRIIKLKSEFNID
jgi:beta-N-acetylhexosaminidase